MPMKRSPQDILTLQKRGLVSMYPPETNIRPASVVTLYTGSRVGLNQYTGTGTNILFRDYGILSNFTNSLKSIKDLG